MKVRKLILSFFIMLLFTILLRIFMVEIFWVPTASMSPSIDEKSYIIVEKVSYGALLPQSINQIPWANTLLLISTKFENFLIKDRWNGKRLPGRSKPVKGDVIVFRDPSNTLYLTKRCIGVPGERISIFSDIWYCDEQERNFSKLVINEWIVETKHFDLTSYFKVNFVKCNSEYLDGEVVDKVHLNGKQVNELKALGILKYLKAPKRKFNLRVEDAASIIKIPAKGDTVVINMQNYQFYAKIINQFEVKEILKSENDIYIDGRLNNKYVFENDYYFLLGDNRSKSIDSRSFGLIPFKNIIGKILYVL
ncbi:signal peptidase I [Marinifilum caeruleilacunae]|uniref:Signal peptidase I n=1 Tax=Marinifilum caeruleilacunae TaxID=2499076 RepID=A0ABX1X1S3_9BACT|nr:signal peptidase I [Marinifilum caeruleilacunae]NOU62033.1 signal peptidase I [Marinifilum caeruleilacunae]